MKFFRVPNVRLLSSVGVAVAVSAVTLTSPASAQDAKEAMAAFIDANATSYAAVAQETGLPIVIETRFFQQLFGAVYCGVKVLLFVHQHQRLERRVGACATNLAGLTIRGVKRRHGGRR